MGLIQTSPFGLMKPSAHITERNQHLLSDIHLRAKRMLKCAAGESHNAFSVCRTMSEYWSRLSTGTKCTCSQKLDLTKERHACNCECKGAPDIAEFLKSGNLRVLDCIETCPICYGTSFEGGYNLFGTASVVLTANNPNLKLSDGLSIKQGSPYTILCGTEGTATWTIDLPKYYHQLHSLVLYWNKQPEEYCLYIDDKLFNVDIFNTLGQIPNKNKTKISIHIVDEEGTTELYYIRFILKITRHTLVSIDIPNPVYSYAGELNIHSERQSTVTLNTPGDIGNVPLRSIFVTQSDDPSGCLGFVVIENEFNAPLGIAIANQTQARLLRSFEKEYTIPSKLLLKNYKMNNFDFLY